MLNFKFSILFLNHLLRTKCNDLQGSDDEIYNECRYKIVT